jgi:hypothetical protein
MEAGGDIASAGIATAGAVLVVLVEGEVVAGGNVVVERGGGGRLANCRLGDDEHAAAITVRRASVPAATNLRRARTWITRRRLS